MSKCYLGASLLVELFDVLRFQLTPLFSVREVCLLEPGERTCPIYFVIAHPIMLSGCWFFALSLTQRLRCSFCLIGWFGPVSLLVRVCLVLVGRRDLMDFLVRAVVDFDVVRGKDPSVGCWTNVWKADILDKSVLLHVVDFRFRFWSIKENLLVGKTIENWQQWHRSCRGCLPSIYWSCIP